MVVAAASGCNLFFFCFTSISKKNWSRWRLEYLKFKRDCQLSQSSSETIGARTTNDHAYFYYYCVSFLLARAEI